MSAAGAELARRVATVLQRRWPSAGATPDAPGRVWVTLPYPAARQLMIVGPGATLRRASALVSDALGGPCWVLVAAVAAHDGHGAICAPSHPDHEVMCAALLEVARA